MRREIDLEVRVRVGSSWAASLSLGRYVAVVANGRVERVESRWSFFLSGGGDGGEGGGGGGLAGVAKVGVLRKQEIGRARKGYVRTNGGN